MSDAHQSTGAVVQDGVKLQKDLNVEDFAVPSIVMTIQAPVRAPATVRIHDPIPDSIGAGDIGFHPKHGGEYWTFDGDHVTFSREFEPGEKYTTVYGVVDADPETDDWLLAEPSIEVIEDEEQVESVPPSEPASEGGTDADADEPAAMEATTDPSDAAEPGESPTDILVQLAIELEEGDPEHVSRVREALLAGRGDPVERGDRLRADIDDLEATIDSIQAAPEEAPDRSADVEALEADIDAMEDRIAEIENTVATEQDPSTSRGGIDEVWHAVDSIREEVEKLESAVEEAHTVTGRNARDIDDIGAEISELTATVESMASQSSSTAGTNGDVADLKESIEAMRADLDSAIAFQEDLKSTLLEYRST